MKLGITKLAHGPGVEHRGGMTLALAGWFRYLRGTDLDGREIDVVDPRLDELQALALRGGADPSSLLAALPGPGDVLGQDQHLVRSLHQAMQSLEHGVAPAMAGRLSRPPADHEPASHPGGAALRSGLST